MTEGVELANGSDPVNGAEHGIVLDRVSIKRGNRVLFRDVSAAVAPGEVLALVGPSGIGKSSLIHALLGEVSVAGGKIRIGGKLPPLPRQQRKMLGFIPQEPRMSADPRLTLAETVAAPLSFGRGRIRPRAKDLNDRALVVWDRMGLERELLDRKPHEVSDGQLQRALVVRGLVRPVKYLLADEPTSALDTRTASLVWDVIKDVVEQDRAAAAIVSHDAPMLTAMATTTIHLTRQ